MSVSHDRKQDEADMLLGELQHRVRNTLAFMRALVRASAENATSVEEYVSHLESRLDALARVQSAVIRNPLVGIDLGLLIADELAACRAHEGSGLHLDGPPVSLHPRAAEPIGLAMHELAVNALKFGALAQQSGQLAVRWRIAELEDGRRLVIDWVETGLSNGETADRHHGFGRTVLEQMLPHNLQARTSFMVTSTKVTCRIELPLTSRVLQMRPLIATD